MKEKAYVTGRRLLFSLLLLASVSVVAQTTPTTKKRCGNKTTTTIAKTTKKTPRPTIVIPDDYKPPVAARSAYTFRETHANKGRLKKLKQKRRKGKGCVAANF